jgi:hypothetical protein
VELNPDNLYNDFILYDSGRTNNIQTDCCVCTLNIQRFQQLHEVLCITKDFDFPNIGLQSLQSDSSQIGAHCGS